MRLALRRPRSLRMRVSVLVLVLLALLLAALFVAVDVALAHGLRTDLSGRLQDRARLAQQLDDGTLSASQLVDRVAGDGVDARICGPSTCAASAGAPTAAPQPQPGNGGGPAGPNRHRGPARAAPVPRQLGDAVVETVVLPHGAVLQLHADASYVSDTVRRLVLAEVLGGLLALVLAGVLLARTLGLALRPLDEMTGVARSITRGDRGRRLRGTDAQGELGRTAAAFDEMLDALEHSESTARGAEDRMRRLLADAAHELRTPVAGARAAAEQLLRSDPPRAERERLAVAVVRESERAGRLVQDLLDLARIDGGLPLEVTLVELHRLADEQADLLRQRLPETVVRVDGAPVTVPADTGRVGQVVANLLVNAARAAGGGGEVAVRVGAQDGHAYVDVRDSGPGVPDGQRERVFERLVRLHDGRARDTGGAGLGLPIARGIARAHGGDVVCLPASDGAWFRLVLPLVP